MPLDSLKIIAVLLHFGGAILITLSFINIALLIYKFCREKVDCPMATKTKMPLSPFLIALGSYGFIFLSFTFFYKVVFEPNLFGLRYFAIAVSLLGSLLIFYGVHTFYTASKNSMKAVN